MTPYSYLVLGVNPTSNEANVSLSAKITISFAKPINTDTLNGNTIRLRKVNGEFLEYVGQYNHVKQQYEITPSAPLEPNTQYQTMVLGGIDGVLSIDGGYLPTTKTYEFVTVQEEVISNLTNLVVTQDYLFVTAKWELPSGLMAGEGIYFNVRLSTSNNPESFEDLWPKNAVEGKTTATEITIPYRLETGRNYYVHVQGVSETRSTEWLTGQVYMEPLATETPTEAPTSGTESPITIGIMEQLSIADHYPQLKEIATPEEVIIVLSGDVSPTLDPKNLYVVQAPYKETLSLIDIRGAYSYNKAVPGTLSIDSENANVLIWTPTGSFTQGKEYTVIVSKNLSGTDGTTLGFTYTFGFAATPEHFHGDIEQIRNMLGSASSQLSDAFLQSLMKKHSQYACDIWTNTSTYDESLHQNGEAPSFIHQYVNLQVVIDALISGSLSTAGGGSESFTLGDLQVTTGGSGGSTTSIPDMVAQLQDQLKDWEDLIHGYHNRGYAKPGNAVKGENVSAYPTPMTRSTLQDFDK